MHDLLTPTFGWILENVYPDERPQTANSTMGKLRAHVARWVSVMDNLPANQVDRKSVLTFRRKCVELGISPSTINSYVRTISDLLRMSSHEIDSKKLKLAERDSPLPTPTIADLGNVWRITASASWPSMRRVNARPVWCKIGPTLWWRGLLMVEFCTGLRRADVFGLKWSDVQEHRIPTINRKTGKLQYLPIPEPLKPWLNLLRKNGTETVLGANDRQSQIDRELNALGKAVGLPGLGCQCLRRAAARAYEKAHAGAGKLILNHGKSVTETSYLEIEDTLRDASAKLIYPEPFLEPPSLERQLLLF